MTDRIWAKVAIMEEHAAVMQSDLARLKAESHFSMGKAALSDGGGEFKEQFFTLSTRLDSRLDDLQDMLEQQVSGQEEKLEDVMNQIVGQQEVQDLIVNAA